jgi:hypothetical protein
VTEQPTTRDALRASDADRDAAVGRLEQALSEGRIGIDEFGRRAEAAYSAGTDADLDRLLADLPSRPHGEIVGDRAPGTLFDTFGHVRVGGGQPPPRRAGSIFGDVRIDLRDLRTDADVIELDLWSIFGDVDVIVAEGVDAVLDGWTILGNRRSALAPVSRLPGTPRVEVRGRTAFGDLRLRTLAPGEQTGRWGALLDRLAQRPQAPVPPPP